MEQEEPRSLYDLDEQYLAERRDEWLEAAAR